MADLAADRNLLFGLLALQNGLVDQVQLVARVQAWTRDKSRPLAAHLVARGDIDKAQRAVVEALTDLHVRKHGGRTEESLAAFTGGRATRESLARQKDSCNRGFLNAPDPTLHPSPFSPCLSPLFTSCRHASFRRGRGSGSVGTLPCIAVRGSRQRDSRGRRGAIREPRLGRVG
jgi:hypothetical protein